MMELIEFLISTGLAIILAILVYIQMKNDD